MSNQFGEVATSEGRFLNILLKAMNFIIIVSGCIMAFTFFLVVILRYVLNADLFAYEEWLLAVAFWMFFMASAVATRLDAHITADILGIVMRNPKTIWRRAVIVKVLELCILLYLTVLGFIMVMEDVSAYPQWQTTIALKIPFVIPRLGIFLGFFFMTVFTILKLVVLFKTGPDESLATDNLSSEG